MNIPEPKYYRSHGTGRFDPSNLRSVGENAIFEENILIFHPENISIGTNVYIGHNTVLKAYHVNELLIGDHSWIGQGCYFHAAGGITIGRAVGIGPMVKILSSAHREGPLDIPVIFNELELREVVIEDGSDIGMGSIVLPGVHIGKGAIVGAGSVVTRSVPELTVVAGSPARILRRRSGSERTGASS